MWINSGDLFGVGGISLDNTRNMAAFRVSSISDLTNVIIPHFNKYPLLTQKHADFMLFKSAIELMSKKEHLTEDGLRKIVAIRASMNKGLSDALKLDFPLITPVQRPEVQLPENFDPN